MDDIVKRLRDCGNGVGDLKTDRGDFGLCDESADEIERLRAMQVPNVNTLAQIIRKVDGCHDLGAAALAEAIIAEMEGE